MNVSKWAKAAFALLIVSISVQVRVGESAAGSAFAQGAPREPAKAPYRGMDPDPWDRNAQLQAHTRTGATSGAQRGGEIYYMQCWMCHSEYVIAGDKWPSPSLRDVSTRMSDELITRTIRRGGSRMPAFGPRQLSDADIADLLTLFKEKCGKFPTGGGCFDEHNPPANPLYKYEYVEVK